MRLFLMRHGAASYHHSDDVTRPLTRTGRQEVRQAGQWLAQQSVQIDTALVSPLVRAEETLLELREQVPVENTEVSSLLVPCAKVDLTLQMIGDSLYRADQSTNLLIVTHMPLVSHLMERLTHGQQMRLFPTAGLASLSLANTEVAATLEQFFSPQTE